MGFFPDLCSPVSGVDLLRMKREIFAGVSQERGGDRSAVRGDVNLWQCSTWRVADSGREI